MGGHREEMGLWKYSWHQPGFFTSYRTLPPPLSPTPRLCPLDTFLILPGFLYPGGPRSIELTKVPWALLTQAQHGLVDLAGSLLTQKPRVLALDGEQSHDP